MEKDSADKATTENENSVTSKEQSSLADEKSENTTGEPKELAPLPTEGNETEDSTTDESQVEPAAALDGEDTQALAEIDAEKSTVDQDNTTISLGESGNAKAENTDKTIAKKPDATSAAKKVSARRADEQANDAISQDEDDSEDHSAGADDETEEIDYTTYSKEELVDVVKKLGKDEDPFKADKILRKIAPLFNDIRAKEREAALAKFVAEGGSEDGFEMIKDELELRFDANYKLIKDKKAQKLKEQETERSKNLILAEDILEELREFMDSEESSASFNAFKNIQQKWKDLGDVPTQNSKTLWANYNALINRFYDQRSIYFELKELDRKKNYEAKVELCEKAEALEHVENLREAIKTLNDLHHEFKHMGPVPQEVQEELWQRFKAASDKVYEKRNEFVTGLKAELSENLTKKEELITKILPFADFNSDRIKDWNQKTKELLAYQKEWDAIGGIPKEKAKEINRSFWHAFKKFFSNKHKFFKKLDGEREENLNRKQALLEKAIALKESDDWDSTANELKKIQNEWREIGPVPEKMRKKIFDDFKAACDEFFENRRKGLKNSQNQYKENLKRKQDIIKEIEALSKDANTNLDKFNALREKFGEVGYVPKNNIAATKDEFQAVVNKFLNELTVLNVKEKTEISLETEFADLASGEHSESDLYHKEQSVRRQIGKLEDDIALWQNNLEFFASSKATDKLRKEFNEKIAAAQNKVEVLRRQLKMLRSM